MMQAFKQMPEPLRKQILLRLGLGTVFLFLLIALLAVTGDMTLWLPCAGLMVFFVAGAFTLFRRVVLGEYLVVRGTCTEAGNTFLKRRAKFIIMDTGEQLVRVSLGQRRKRFTVGMTLNLYLATNAPVYEKDGVLRVFSYLALDVRENAESRE